jgi:hypothetical protein
MVDLKQKTNQNTNQAKGETKKKEKWQQQKGFRPEEKKKDPDAIPTLKYGPSNNFMRFKKHCQRRHY